MTSRPQSFDQFTLREELRRGNWDVLPLYYVKFGRRSWIENNAAEIAAEQGLTKAEIQRFIPNIYL